MKHGDDIILLSNLPYENSDKSMHLMYYGDYNNNHTLAATKESIEILTDNQIVEIY